MDNSLFYFFKSRQSCVVYTIGKQIGLQINAGHSVNRVLAKRQARQTFDMLNSVWNSSRFSGNLFCCTHGTLSIVGNLQVFVNRCLRRITNMKWLSENEMPLLAWPSGSLKYPHENPCATESAVSTVSPVSNITCVDNVFLGAMGL